MFNFFVSFCQEEKKAFDNHWFPKAWLVFVYLSIKKKDDDEWNEFHPCKDVVEESDDNSSEDGTVIANNKVLNTRIAGHGKLQSRANRRLARQLQGQKSLTPTAAAGVQKASSQVPKSSSHSTPTSTVTNTSSSSQDRTRDNFHIVITEDPSIKKRKHLEDAQKVYTYFLSNFGADDANTKRAKGVVNNIFMGLLNEMEKRNDNF